MISTGTAIKYKSQEREKLDAKIQEFLDSGGHIDIKEVGENSYRPMTQRDYFGDLSYKKKFNR